MAFTISIKGINKTIQALEAEARQLSDHRDFLRDEVAPLLKREFRDVFRSRGYGKWLPLAPSTIAQRRRDGYGTAPLIRTGNYLKNSANLRGQRIRRNVLEITSPINYAMYHEFGTSRIPSRPVFKYVADRIRPELQKLYNDWRRRRTT